MSSRTFALAGAPLIVALIASLGSAAQPPRSDATPLVKLASSKFPNLTSAELALLQHVDVNRVERGPNSVSGTSDNPDDATNDPARAEQWGPERTIRATLIRWLCANPDAVKLVEPGGINILGARIAGDFDLGGLRVPFQISLFGTWIPDGFLMYLTEIPSFTLLRCRFSHFIGGSMAIRGDFTIFGSQSDAEIFLEGSKIGGDVGFDGSRVRHALGPLYLGPGWGNLPAEESKTALDVSNAEIGGRLGMCCGFEADGKVTIAGTTVAGDYNAVGGRFSNPGEIALDATNANIKGNAYLASRGQFPGFQADGAVQFVTANVGGSLVVNHAKFMGQPGQRNGFFAPGASIKHSLIWQNVNLEHGAQLDLSGANVGALLDDEKSWPSAGNLNVEGLSYDFLAAGPIDKRARLRWILLQPGFYPQPYRQLAKTLRQNGDDAGAIEVLIAEEDARFRDSGWLGRVWAGFLNITVGYGHKPLRSVLWSLAVIILGWQLVSLGARAGVMRATWPDSPPPSETATYEKLHPLLYSLDVFLPFVNLHQEHYWWPDAERSGDFILFGRKLRISGSFLRYYLWTQVIAGWMLSAIFVAGVTGLLRND